MYINVIRQKPRSLITISAYILLDYYLIHSYAVKQSFSHSFIHSSIHLKAHVSVCILSNAHSSQNK